jgi:hypothetical protein
MCLTILCFFITEEKISILLVARIEELDEKLSGKYVHNLCLSEDIYFRKFFDGSKEKSMLKNAAVPFSL